ncbi:PPIC-type PPIASE domain-containing protein [Sporobacter termitidis DSM 10068]|uniref:PPIC-type PPIASE domain-containing protein n=1 Tax=Sporobacter termitidis DSM 10068 TaxID=1123282 RepID=A0A1M5VV85_9FIRM|nr:peptidylprolyl isomerase [Sporobacter termitidis]SHH79108.1 PPIC-type PPIASE domain-containing protein [Sporobacter termitidis DSM 10068]
MKYKKITVLLTGAVLLVSVFSGCSQTAKSPFVSPDASPSSSGGAAAQTLNIAGAYKSLDPKTVMMTVNGKDVTWDELFYYINYDIYQLQSKGDQVTDWSAAYQDEQTYAEYILNDATRTILQNAAVEYGADQQKISLSEQDQSDIQADWDSQVQAAEGEEALLAELQSQYSSKDIYTHLQQISRLALDCFTSMYGDKGSKLSDQDVADYTAEDGYLMAKHILMVTTNTDETGNETPMTDEEKAAVKAKMEDILNQLNAYQGSDFDGFFDQLMKQYSQDPGVEQSPEGYLFQSGEMVSQFEDATKALEIGKYTTSLVESEFGYHIIYRIPINYDSTPSSYAPYGQYSLRYITALNMFNANVETWQNSMDVTYSDKYKALDFSKLFAAG